MDHGELYEFGPFRLDVRNVRLERQGRPVPLAPRSFDVLTALIRRAGQLVEKDALMREVWPDTFVEEANVSRQVWTLRKALGDSGTDEEYIETVPKRGYRFAAAVRLVGQPEPVVAGRTEADTIHREATTVRSASHWRLWIVACAVAVGVGWAAWRMWGGQESATSREALRIFSIAETAREEGRLRDALPAYKHAIELDPRFAMAESRLADIYRSLREPAERRAHAARAYELRAQANERDRLVIEATYFDAIGDVARQADALQLLIAAYPGNAAPHQTLAGLYRETGRYEPALDAARASARLDPRSAQARAVLGRALVDLNRFDEAQAVLDADREAPAEALHALLFELAFLHDDRAGMQRQLDWAARSVNEYSAAIWQARVHDFRGQRAKAREWFARSLVLLKTRGGDERTAEDAAINASRDAIVGDCAATAGGIDQALSVRTMNTLTLASLALALCGNFPRADVLVTELAGSEALDWLNRTVSVPIIRAFIEAGRGSPARAAELAATIEPYELGQTLWPIYLRGLIHLKAGQFGKAESAFRKILAHRGPAGLSIRYPLAHLQLARALGQAGDRQGSRRAYETFLDMWKDADQDLPILIDAKREYATSVPRGTP